MLTILTILVSVILVSVLAYFIVNKSSPKTRPIISILLWLLIIFLGYKIYDGIMSPIKFKNEKEARYTPVIENLKMIRDAQVAHKDVTGDYSKDKNKLITFIDTAKFALTEVRNEAREVNVGTSYQPLMVTKEFRIVDTVGYEPVKDRFKNRKYKDMFKVPGTDVEFELKADYVEKVQGIKSPVFLAQVAKDAVLKGLDRNLIKAEKEAFGGTEVSGEFISVGSLDDVKVNGNWPPKYDTAEEKEDK